MFSGASHPDVSDAGGDHLHTGGQYALDSQAEQDQYEGELQCLADRVETPEEKKRLSEAMELSNIREHLKSQDVYIVEVPLRSKNGKYRQKQIRCMYLNQQTGTLLLMLSDVEDIVKEEKEKQDSLQIEQETSKIVTGEELRRFFDRNYDMNHPIEEKEEWDKETRQLPEQDQR